MQLPVSSVQGPMRISRHPDGRGLQSAIDEVAELEASRLDRLDLQNVTNDLDQGLTDVEAELSVGVVASIHVSLSGGQPRTISSQNVRVDTVGASIVLVFDDPIANYGVTLSDQTQARTLYWVSERGATRCTVDATDLAGVVKDLSLGNHEFVALISVGAK
jgi:hypothetical protein